MIRPISIENGETVFVDSEPTDLLTYRLIKSVKQTHKHQRTECLSTSSSGCDTAYVRWLCECREAWTEEMTNAEYLHFIESYEEPVK